MAGGHEHSARGMCAPAPLATLTPLFRRPRPTRYTDHPFFRCCMQMATTAVAVVLPSLSAAMLISAKYTPLPPAPCLCTVRLPPADSMPRLGPFPSPLYTTHDTVVRWETISDPHGRYTVISHTDSMWIHSGWPIVSKRGVRTLGSRTCDGCEPWVRVV